MVQSAEKKIILDLTTNNTFAAQSVAVLEKDIINFSNAEIPVAPKANCSKIYQRLQKILNQKLCFQKQIPRMQVYPKIVGHSPQTFYENEGTLLKN